MAENWKEGDAVQLKSGGPVMTVQEVRSDGTVHCQWFDGNDLKSGLFAAASIERYETRTR